MAAVYFFGLLANPLSVAVLVLIVVGVSRAQLHGSSGPWNPTPRALAKGYTLALLAALPAALFISYISPEEAMSRFKVPPENYWKAQLNEALVTFTFAAYATSLGIAVVGLRAIILLARFRMASVPAVMAAAVAISVVACATMTIGDDPAFKNFLPLARELVAGHVLTAMAFCVGVGLPWRARAGEA